MSISAAQAKITLYARFENKVCFEYPAERYDRPVLFLLTQGSFLYQLDDRTPRRLSAGEFACCPADSVFRRQTLSCICLHMLQTSDAVLSAVGAYQGPLTRRMEQDLSCITQNGVVRTEKLLPETVHYCRDILLETVRQVSVCDRKPQLLLEPALAYIDANLDQPLSNASLQQLLHCSQGSLITAFRTVTGLSPGKYIAMRRLQRAEFLLQTEALSVQEVALRCGYPDALYFSRVFSARHGVPPSVYREQSKRTSPGGTCVSDKAVLL